MKYVMKTTIFQKYLVYTHVILHKITYELCDITLPDFPLISLALRFLAFKRVNVNMELLG